MSHRLFVAIRPPEPVIDALVDTMEALEGARWQDAEQLHLTLRFIGEVDRWQAEDIADTLSSLAMRPLQIAIAGVGHFDRQGVPRAIWAKIVPSRELTDLQSSVEQACQRTGLAPETRRFTPHITIARLNRSSGDIAGWLARHDRLAPAPFIASSFALFESLPGKSGSIYRAIARFPDNDRGPGKRAATDRRKPPENSN